MQEIYYLWDMKAKVNPMIENAKTFEDFEAIRKELQKFLSALKFEILFPSIRKEKEKAGLDMWKKAQRKRRELGIEIPQNYKEVTK